MNPTKLYQHCLVSILAVLASATVGLMINACANVQAYV